MSQYRAANQILKKQNRVIHEKNEIANAMLDQKNAKAARELLLKQVKGKVRNYIRKDNDDEDDGHQQIEINQ